MIVALVWITVFLMMRYRDDGAKIPDVRRHPKRFAKIGTVDPAIILADLAALMPSDVLTLIQVAMTVIIGLVILVIVLVDYHVRDGRADPPVR